MVIMVDFSRTKTFDPGTLGANLEDFDRKVERAVTRLCDEEATFAQSYMREAAPWTQTGFKNRWGRVSTGRARSGLYTHTATTGTGRFGIKMGYTATPYGKYLELAMEERFQIVIPTMLDTAESLMRSLTELFVELNEGEAVSPYMAPAIHAKPAARTESQVVSVTHHYVNKTKREVFRDIRGRFVKKAIGLAAVAKNTTKRTRRTKRG